MAREKVKNKLGGLRALVSGRGAFHKDGDHLLCQIL